MNTTRKNTAMSLLPAFRKGSLALLCLLLLTACGSGKTATTSSTATTDKNNAQLAYMQRVTNTAQTASFLTANLGVKIEAGKKSISCNGKLRMKRNDVIQLMLTIPLIGTEVGRIECTPSEVLIVDRINKQYLRGKYSDVSFLSQAGLDFYTLQSLFWNELFVPGQKNISTALGRFRTSSAGAHTLLALTDAPQLEYDFLTLTEKAKIDRVTIRSKKASEKGEVIFKYGSFSSVGGKLFPTTMELAMKDFGKDVSLQLNLSKPDNNTDWETRTTVSNKYTRRNADEVLQQIMKLAN